MSEFLVNQLKQLCHNNGLDCTHKGNGHYHVIGPKKVLVNYYPYSKNQTMYIAGLPTGVKGVTPEMVVRYALGETDVRN